MKLVGCSELIKAVLFISLAMHFYEAHARTHRELLAAGGPAVFDVTKYGAKGDGKEVLDEDGNPLNNFAFMKAWNEACHTDGPAKVLIPPGKYVISQVLFAGPCESPNLIIEVQGTLIASTDLSLYPSPEWFMIERVDGVLLTGTGTFDARGDVNWKSNDCKTNPSCVPLPASIKLHRVNNSVVENIKSVNSMFFHMFLTYCLNATVRNVNLVAPADSPNTDGIHTSCTENVLITDSIIATGDDCVSVGQGSVNITVNGVTCGPGHGLSVGSLGKDPYEKPVRLVRVRNCTLQETDNGARVKSRLGKIVNQASDIIFEDLIMENVRNPIIIDQRYGGKKKKAAGLESQVKISNVQFKKIRGTSVTNTLINFICSPKVPCEGIQVADIDLKPMPLKGVAETLSSCVNAKVTFSGKHDELNCDGTAA